MLPNDISASSRYYAEDITEPFLLDDGCLTVPDGPGSGVTVLSPALSRFTVSTERLYER